MQSNWRQILSWQEIDNDFVYSKVESDGSIGFYNSKDQLHRLSGPALMGMKGRTKGYKGWFVNGKFIEDNEDVESHKYDVGSGFTDEKFEKWKRERNL